MISLEKKITIAEVVMVFLTLGSMLHSCSSARDAAESERKATSAQNKVIEIEKDIAERECVLAINPKFEALNKRVLDFTRVMIKCELGSKKACVKLKREVWPTRNDLKSFGRLIKNVESIGYLNDGIKLANDVEKVLREYDDGPKRNQKLNELGEKSKNIYLKIREIDLQNQECKTG